MAANKRGMTGAEMQAEVLSKIAQFSPQISSCRAPGSLPS